MKNKAILCLILSGALALGGCVGNSKVDYSTHLDDYVKTMQYRDGFNILQLSDIHWSTGTDGVTSKTQLEKTIKEAENHAGKIDLIELTGDLFMLSNKETVVDFLDFMSSLDIPFATVWGNHDREGKYSQEWISDKFLTAKNSLYSEVKNDDVYGYSNYVVNLTSDGTENGETKWQLVQLDSGASYIDSAFGIGRTYDYIRDSQTEWFKAEHDKVGASVPCIAYFHIAQWEFDMAEKDISEGATYKHKFFKNEDFCASTASNSTFFDVAKDNGLKGLFVGHAHADDYTVDYKGVTMGFGVKSGIELYYTKIQKGDERITPDFGIDEDFDLVGASLVTLHDGGTFDLEHLYYNVREGEDFIKWVRY